MASEVKLLEHPQPNHTAQGEVFSKVPLSAEGPGPPNISRTAFDSPTETSLAEEN